MKACQVALAMLGSFTLGTVAVEGLHAQVKPPAFVVAEVAIAGPDGYAKEFLPAFLKTIQDADGKFLARGGRVIWFDGDVPAPHVFIVQLESLEKAQTWWNSPPTKAAVAIGQKYATFRQYAVEGLSQ